VATRTPYDAQSKPDESANSKHSNNLDGWDMYGL
jgi:hypothetical protein